MPRWQFELDATGGSIFRRFSRSGEIEMLVTMTDLDNPPPDGPLIGNAIKLYPEATVEAVSLLMVETMNNCLRFVESEENFIPDEP